jgi:DNA-binding transcriptional ArsR family regulator
MAPSIADDEELVLAHTRVALRAASPEAAATLTRMSAMIDIRHVLPAIRVPTLVLYRRDEIFAEASRFVGKQIPGAKVVELPGADHMPWLGDQESALDEIEEFLTGVRPHPVLDRVLATVLFTDIVGSTKLAAASATGAGATCSSSTTRSFAVSSTVSAAESSARPATASSRPSTAPHARSRAPSRFATPRDLSACRSASGSTPESSSWPGRTSAASRCTPVPAWRRLREPARSSPRARSGTSSPARASSSRTAAPTSSRACPASGACTRSPTPRLDIFLYRNIIAGMARAATTTDAFNAVAEPRRRQIIDALADGERPVNDLVRELALAQPQVSKHLRVLREVGAVDVREEGRQRLYRLNGQALRPIHDWVKAYERSWSERFEQLEVVLEELKQKEEGDGNDD